MTIHNENNERERRKKTIANVEIARAGSEVVGRYGFAIKEYHVAYNGIDNEAGKALKKGLKEINKYKVSADPVQAKKNLKQQAGYSAEVGEVARENAERIIKGEKTRVVRADDVGYVSHPLYDTFVLDEAGNIIKGSGMQMKFVGSSGADCAEKLMSHKFDKYRDNNVPIEVPSDYFDECKKTLNDKASKVKKQLESAQTKGDAELTQKHWEELQRIEKTRDTLEKSKLSSAEAMALRVNPKLGVAKDIVRLGHRGGVEAARMGAVVGGGIALISNIVSVAKGDKEIGEATLDAVKNTGGAAALGYGSGFVGGVVGGAMKNSGSQYIRCLGKAGLPAQIVTVALETTKTCYRYFSGEIDGTECLTELGEKGTGMLASAAGATVGQMVIPIPVVGGLIGGMIGYSLSSAYYAQLVFVLNKAKLTKEELRQVHEECEIARRSIRKYRAESERLIAEYLTSFNTEFRQSFANMQTAYHLEDADAFIENCNETIKQFGGKSQFETFAQFDAMMSSDEPIVI
jgi:esterase/lipase